jgi:cell division protein FtsW (lipid II flippase)
MDTGNSRFNYRSLVILCMFSVFFVFSAMVAVNAKTGSEAYTWGSFSIVMGLVVLVILVAGFRKRV